jgi:hypothetical protein
MRYHPPHDPLLFGMVLEMTLAWSVIKGFMRPSFPILTSKGPLPFLFL